jgi:hypothetical protein
MFWESYAGRECYDMLIAGRVKKRRMQEMEVWGGERMKERASRSLVEDQEESECVSVPLEKGN